MDAHSAAGEYRAWLDTLDFDEDGCITAIIQDRQTRAILTLSRMSREALERTLASGRIWLFSRRQRRLLHRSGDGAAFRPVVEVLESDGGSALVFFVDHVTGSDSAQIHFHPALIRADGAGTCVDAAGSSPDAEPLIGEMGRVFELVADRLRVLPLGLEHTFRSFRSLLREAERNAHTNQDRLLNSVAALVARLLVFIAARGVTWRDFVAAVQAHLMAQAIARTDSGLSEECR